MPFPVRRTRDLHAKNVRPDEKGIPFPLSPLTGKNILRINRFHEIRGCHFRGKLCNFSIRKLHF